MHELLPRFTHQNQLQSGLHKKLLPPRARGHFTYISHKSVTELDALW